MTALFNEHTRRRRDTMPGLLSDLNEALESDQAIELRPCDINKVIDELNHWKSRAILLEAESLVSH